MLIEDFNTKFGAHIGDGDFPTASYLMLSKLGDVLANKKETFVDLLKQSDIHVPEFDSSDEKKLIEIYVDNLGKNKKLALGSSLLVNIENKTVGFDGESEVNDENVKTGYALLHNYFCGADGLNVSPDPIGAIAGAVSSIANVGAKGIEARQKKMENRNAVMNTALDVAKKKAEARSQLLNKVADANIQKTQSAKSKKIWWIVGGSVLAVALITGTIIYIKTRKK